MAVTCTTTTQQTMSNVDSSVGKFYNDMICNLAKPKLWEVVFRIRVSAGWRKTAQGNFLANSFNDLLRMDQIDESANQ